MKTLHKAVIAIVFLLSVALAFMVSMRACESFAEANPGITEADVLAAVVSLKPNRNPRRLAYWARVMHEAATENHLDPLLVTAMVFRESSFKADVRSEGGSIGPFQVKAKGIAYYRHRPNRCDLHEIRCNIRTGASFLAWVRQYCGEPWAVWVGGYGMSSCPTLEYAETHVTVRRARAIYESIGGTQWR